MSLNFVVRTQYTFSVSERKLALLLNLNVVPLNNPHRVNVVALTIIKTSKRQAKPLIIMVVGTDDPNDIALGGAGDPTNPDPLRSNNLQNQQFVRNLKTLNVRFKSHPVIQIFNVEAATGTPGIYRLYVSSLVCAHIPIISFYTGERRLLRPLIIATFPDGTQVFNQEVISAFIQVPKRKLCKATAVLGNLQLTTPFIESSICINTNTVQNLFQATAACFQACH